jgi:hypothetical protein
MTGVSGIDNVDDLLAVEGVDVFFIVLYRPGRSNAPRSQLCLTRLNSNLFGNPTGFRLLSRCEISGTHGWQRGKHGIFGIHNLNLGEGITLGETE